MAETPLFIEVGYNLDSDEDPGAAGRAIAEGAAEYDGVEDARLMEDPHVVLSSSAAGLQVFGPFVDREEANEFGEENFPNDTEGFVVLSVTNPSMIDA
jgi:hypothetical protein